jgi:hypothetical protein
MVAEIVQSFSSSYKYNCLQNANANEIYTINLDSLHQPKPILSEQSMQFEILVLLNPSTWPGLCSQETHHSRCHCHGLPEILYSYLSHNYNETGPITINNWAEADVNPIKPKLIFC